MHRTFQSPFERFYALPTRDRLLVSHGAIFVADHTLVTASASSSCAWVHRFLAHFRRERVFNAESPDGCGAGGAVVAQSVQGRIFSGRVGAQGHRNQIRSAGNHHGEKPVQIGNKTGEKMYKEDRGNAGIISVKRAKGTNAQVRSCLHTSTGVLMGAPWMSKRHEQVDNHSDLRSRQVSSPCARSAASCLWLREDRRMRINAVMSPKRGLAQVNRKVSAEESHARI